MRLERLGNRSDKTARQRLVAARYYRHRVSHCGPQNAKPNRLPFLLYQLHPDRYRICHHLYEQLQESGVRCWYAPEDVQGGKKVHHQLDQAIREHDKLLLILSPDSMQSNWVEYELRRARRRERTDNRRMLFPLRLTSYETLQAWECFDGDEGRDLAAEVREYFIPDFSNWSDTEAFNTAFARLLRDLQEAGETSAA